MTPSRDSAFPILRNRADLRAQVRDWRAQGLTVALVPTMGALHQGHMALVREGLRRADRVLASVFVNPIQFGPNEDLARYPRQEEADVTLLRETGCHGLYAPTVAGMYPDGFASTVGVGGPAEGLCGAFRPGHFAGVATVVTKLLLQCQPDLALFGEKDFQQLKVIDRLVRDLDIPVEIVGVPTVREADGLALSSRNRYLTVKERRIAPELARILQDLARDLRAGAATEDASARATDALLRAGFDSVDYVAVRDNETLAPASRLAERPLRALAAARLPHARLIDNLAIFP